MLIKTKKLKIWKTFPQNSQHLDVKGLIKFQGKGSLKIISKIILSNKFKMKPKTIPRDT